MVALLHISLWGFSLFLVLSGAPVVAGASPGAFVVLPSVQSRGTIDSRTGIIQPRALINMCLQFLTNIPRAGCMSQKLPVPMAFVVI